MATPRLIWSPPRRTEWQKFRAEPTAFIVQWLHQLRPDLPPASPLGSSSAITVVCISDTHETQPDVPDGDLLLHAGDLTNNGHFEPLQAQIDWLASLPHRHKVVIAGNHDELLDADFVARSFDSKYEREGLTAADLNWHDIVYLNNSSRTPKFANGRKLNIFGSPWTPQYGNFAFQYPPIRDVWTGTVPEDTDVLLTHGPPKGYLDLEGKGCPHLTREIARIKPRLAVFGHIHAGHGREEICYRGVERRFQETMITGGKFCTVLGMLFWLFIAWATRLLSFIFGPKEGVPCNRTTLINAAVVGGFRNEKSRPASVFEI